MVKNCTFCAAERSSQTFFLWSEMTNMICISPIWSRLVLSFNFDFSSLQVADWLRTRVEVQNWLRLLPFALLAHSYSARYFQQQQNSWSRTVWLSWHSRWGSGRHLEKWAVMTFFPEQRHILCHMGTLKAILASWDRKHILPNVWGCDDFDTSIKSSVASAQKTIISVTSLGTSEIFEGDQFFENQQDLKTKQWQKKH